MNNLELNDKKVLNVDVKTRGTNKPPVEIFTFCFITAESTLIFKNLERNPSIVQNESLQRK
jgi:hypothetical protein